MGMIVADCPRCPARDITFDIQAGRYVGSEYGWKHHFEIYCECRGCSKGSIFGVATKDYENHAHYDEVEKILQSQRGLNSVLEIRGYLSLKDEVSAKPPEHLPQNVEDAFREGATCFAVQCFNASGTMFRLAIDLATKGLLAEVDASQGGPNRQQRKNLHERLEFLFDKGAIPRDLHDLAMCIKDDAKDGAHDGTLTKADAEDIQDFATELFRRMFTEPERLRLARVRRDGRER